MDNCTADHASAKINTLTNAINVASSEADLTQLYIERGHFYQLLGDAVNSVRDFLSALDIATSNSDIVHIKSMIALALAQKDQKEQALFWATSAVDQDPCNAEGCHTLGLVCEFCNFLNLAVESLQRAIRLEPHRWESMRVLGSCLRENGRLQDSVEMLSQYVVNNPDEPLGLYGLGWSLQLLARGDVDKMQKAKDMYERALKNNPDSDMRPIIERKLGDIQSRIK